MIPTDRIALPKRRSVCWRAKVNYGLSQVYYISEIAAASQRKFEYFLHFILQLSLTVIEARMARSDGGEENSSSP